MKLKMKNLLLIILTLFNCFYIKSDDKAACAIAGGAIGAAAGYGFYKLFSSFSSSSDQLVDQGFKELIKAKALSKQLEIIDKEFKGLSGIDLKESIIEINEELSEQLAANAPENVINQHYRNELKQNIKNLKYYQDKFPKRIRKLQKFKNKEKYESVINDMNELVCRINILLPKMMLLNQYIDNHLRYFELDEIMNSYSNFYKSELRMVASKKISVNDLKRCIYSKYNNSSYPLLDYVNEIDKSISNFDKYISKANIRYEQLVQDANSLKNKMTRIKHILTSDKDYYNELRALENARNQEALEGGMLLLGAAAGIATGAAIASSNKEKVVIEKNNDLYYEIESPTEYVVYE